MRWSRRRCTEVDNDKRSAFPQPADNGMRPPGFFAPERACATEGIPCTGAGGAVRGACASSRHPTQAAAVRIFGRRFLLDGEPFVIRSGEMHPVRVPTRIGRHRIRMTRAMGLNTVSMYVHRLAPVPAASASTLA